MSRLVSDFSLHVSRSAEFSRRAACWVLLGLLAAGPVFAHGSLHERIAYFQKQIEAAPGDARARCRLAELYIEHGECDRALTVLREAEAVQPGLDEIDLVRGEAFLQSSRPAEALEALDRCLARSPELSLAFRRRARAQAALGETTKSLADFRLALGKTSAPDPDLYQEVADALAVDGHVDEALAVLTQGTRTLGVIPSLLLRCIEIEATAGRFDRALERIDALQQSAPRPEPWKVRRAELLKQAGRPGEARAAWQALADHLAALPARERGSHAMFRFAERARRELAAASDAPRISLFHSTLPSVR